MTALERSEHVGVLDGEEAARVLEDYERRHRIARPVIHRLLSKLTGLAYDGSPEARRNAAGFLPVLGFRPAQLPSGDDLLAARA